jgi:NAD(P)-dependent dehydrogenase (short-subunit alcohol dehydrogenase family)
MTMAAPIPVFDPRTAFRLDGTVCIVTGAGSGIGRAIAFAAARSGARVQVLDINGEAAAITRAEIVAEGRLATDWHVDVADETAVVVAFKAIARAEGSIDSLVNNAGLAIRHPAVDLERADWQRVIDVNMTGVFLCARIAARHMIPARRGAIVNMSSIMGLSGGGLYPNISYQTTKGAVVNLTRALAVEWATHGIRVNAIAPTWVRTEFIRPLLENPELVARMEAAMPLGRVAETEDIVGAVLFLLSPAAAMVTGHTLPVDGGYLAQ